MRLKHRNCMMCILSQEHLPSICVFHEWRDIPTVSAQRTDDWIFRHRGLTELLLGW